MYTNGLKDLGTDYTIILITYIHKNHIKNSKKIFWSSFYKIDFFGFIITFWTFFYARNTKMSITFIFHKQTFFIYFIKISLELYFTHNFNLHFPPNFTHFVNKTRLLRFHLILLIFIVKSVKLSVRFYSFWARVGWWVGSRPN